MATAFLGFDHLDVRVRSLAAVEVFYDALMPALGLTEKIFAHVDVLGNWHEPSDDRPYNTVEFHEPETPGRPRHFIGFIEDPHTIPPRTRIAFRVASQDGVLAWERRLRELGAQDVEFDEDMDAYPAVFFADPAGTQLEICARRPRS